jgi:hypothetical protein
MKDAFGVDREAVSKKIVPLSAKEKKEYKMTGGEKVATAGLVTAAGAGGFTAGFHGLNTKPGAIGAGVAASSVLGAGVIGQRRRKRVNALRASQGKSPRSIWTGQPKKV